MHIVRRSILIALALGLASGCGEEEPALRLGDLDFSAEQTAGLSPDNLAVLADLSAVGAAVMSDRADSLVAPLVQRDVERARLEALPEYLGARRMGISEDQMRAAYAASPEWELSVRHVVRLVPRWANDAARAEARRIAADVERRARAGEDFAALAAQLSEEPGAAERGGLLEPGREGSWVDPFWKAALELQPGEVSPVVETEYGYHVLRLDGRRELAFEDAARLPILRRLVPRAQAIAAMEEWVTAQPPVVLDPPAVSAARAALLQGSAPDSLVLARSPSGAEFTAFDLAPGWAILDPGERDGLQQADDAAFGAWAAEEARQAFWADAARALGAEPPTGTESAARTRWRQQVERWGTTFGIREGMSGDQIEAAVLAGLATSGQEARIVRLELRAMRPILRRAYPVETSAPAS